MRRFRVRPHQKRYLIEVLPALLLIAAWAALSAAGAPALPVALLPVAAMLWIVVALARRLLAKDELEQRIELFAIAFASAAIGLASFAWALLERAHVVARGSLLYVLPGLVAAYGAAKLCARWRYR